MRRRAFTLMEMLIVGLVLALITAFALPRVAATPKRLIAQHALNSIRQAVNDTATRARATGSPCKIVLDMENSRFLVATFSTDLPRDWQIPWKRDAEGAAGFQVISAAEHYRLPSEIEWLPAETGLDQYDEISYAFFEDGQAAGLPLRFRVAGRYYQMDVDKLTGVPLIEELNQ